MIRYPKEFKEQVLKRLLPPNAESVKRVAEETGVSHQTLRNWMQEAHIHDLVQSLPPEPPSSLSTSEKFRIVVETLSMSEDELSEYARKAGLYVTQIKEWRDICVNANATEDAQKRSMQKELKAVQKENSELRKDLRKKEKALAETAALLVLRKKAEAIWGESGDD
jgi:transposase-like protein